MLRGAEESGCASDCLGLASSLTTGPQQNPHRFPGITAAPEQPSPRGINMKPTLARDPADTRPDPFQAPDILSHHVIVMARAGQGLAAKVTLSAGALHSSYPAATADAADGVVETTDTVFEAEGWS